MCAWKSRIDPSAIGCRLPDPGALCWRDVQLVARLHLECRIPGVDVPDDAVHSVLAEAVGIAGRQALDLLRRRLAGPCLCPAEENTLVASKASDERSGLALQRRMIGVERHRKTAEIGDV